MEISLKSDDINRYLNNSICIFNGKPVLIKVVVEAGSLGNISTKVVQGYSLPDGMSSTINISDPSFQVFPWNVGFYNSHSKATFLYRFGYRNSFYGLRSAHLKAASSPGFSSTVPSCHDEGFVEMLKNEYPSFADALKAVVVDDKISRAFHTNYAVSRHPTESDIFCLIQGVGGKIVNVGIIETTEDGVFVKIDPYLNKESNKKQIAFLMKTGMFK